MKLSFIHKTEHCQIKEVIDLAHIFDSEAHISDYDESEKRLIDGKIENVTYHHIDWVKCFHPGLAR